MVEMSSQKGPPNDEHVETGDSGNNSLEMMESVCPSIIELFKGKCVLVTGATGFLGKVLVEKLLRSCKGIKEILILIRPSKIGSAEARLEQYRRHHVFDRLRDENPDALSKLKALSGDVTLDNVGLAGSLLQKVITDVNFVFHCAANVRFDDEARNTLSINLLGVHNILNVCKKCVQLQAFVHVSTAYCFCNHRVISEQIYSELVKPEHIIETTRWMTDDQLHATCMYYIQGKPALYHFSKALAETLLVESNHEVPAIIVRPSIVTASVKEPYAGWIDNYNGPSGFISVCGKGIVQTLLVNENVNADWVPVDIVVNTLIVAAHYIAVTSKSSNATSKLSSRGKVPIINCTCPESNAITWMKIAKICVPFLKKYPSEEVYGMPGGTVTPSPLRYYTCRFFYHYLPAVLIDGISCLMWKKPRLVRLYNNIHRVMSYLEYYTTRSFTFRSSNMRKLVEQMEPEDREVFPIDQNVLNWNEYIENYVLGVRRYFLREKDDTLPDARKRMMRIHYTWMTIKISCLVGMLALIQSLHQRGFLRSTLLTSFSLVAVTTMISRKNAS